MTFVRARIAVSRRVFPDVDPTGGNLVSPRAVIIWHEVDRPLPNLACDSWEEMGQFDWDFTTKADYPAVRGTYFVYRYAVKRSSKLGKPRQRISGLQGGIGEKRGGRVVDQQNG